MPKADPSVGARRWLQPAAGSESNHSGKYDALVQSYLHKNQFAQRANTHRYAFARVRPVYMRTRLSVGK
jgi:hypothetical protein